MSCPSKSGKPLYAVLVIAGLFLAGTASGAGEKKVEKSGAPIEVQVVPQAESIEPGGSLQLSLLITNRSAGKVRPVRLLAAAPELRVELSPLPGDIDPFDTVFQQVEVRPARGARFGTHRLLLVLWYTWQDGRMLHRSAQTASVDLGVRRKFEEEAKGLPGGSAAILYLILPVLPALFGYHFAERWRTGEGSWLPVVSGENIALAAFLALAGNAILAFLGPWIGAEAFLDFSDAAALGRVLSVSFFAGAFVPLVRRAWIRMQMREWGFRDKDEPGDYLRKVLLGPSGSAGFWQASGKAQGTRWVGVRLEQPNGKAALGSHLEISLGNPSQSLEELKALVRDATDGVPGARKKLVDEVAARRYSIQAVERVTCDGKPWTSALAVTEDRLGRMEWDAGKEERTEFLRVAK